MEEKLSGAGGPDQFAEVARFEFDGDVRVMSVGRRRAGEIILREELSGPSAEVAFGVGARRMEASFADSDVPALQRAIKALYPAATLAEYAQQEEADLLDLMDLCDRELIPYGYSCFDSDGNGWFRPAEG